MQTQVHRSAQAGAAPEGAVAERIALALMGVGTLNAEILAETATWDRSNAPCAVGRAIILTTLCDIIRPVSITIDQVVAHGKAATVSGRLTRDGSGTHLFCHIIRFTTPRCRDIAQLVSFEQREG
ncbi:hypothetical protein [Celeribacter sp.]|uniref:hypothetical protein n=1 Tax=Celeribacter sp. TaxID=1890673 RepID=UPI003A8F7DEF